MSGGRNLGKEEEKKAKKGTEAWLWCRVVAFKVQGGKTGLWGGDAYALPEERFLRKEKNRKRGNFLALLSIFVRKEIREGGLGMCVVE